MLFQLSFWLTFLHIAGALTSKQPPCNGTKDLGHEGPVFKQRETILVGRKATIPCHDFGSYFEYRWLRRIPYFPYWREIGWNQTQIISFNSQVEDEGTYVCMVYAHEKANPCDKPIAVYGYEITVLDPSSEESISIMFTPSSECADKQLSDDQKFINISCHYEMGKRGPNPKITVNFTNLDTREERTLSRSEYHISYYPQTVTVPNISKPGLYEIILTSPWDHVEVKRIIISSVSTRKDSNTTLIICFATVAGILLIVFIFIVACYLHGKCCVPGFWFDFNHFCYWNKRVGSMNTDSSLLYSSIPTKQRNVSDESMCNGAHPQTSSTPQIIDQCSKWGRGFNDNYWDIKRGDIVMGEVVGEGAFGRVLKAEYFNGNSVEAVAIKMLKEPMSELGGGLEEFKKEMAMMKKVGHHPNLIGFHGVCMSSEPFFLVVEWAEHGNLKDYLTQFKPRFFVKKSHLSEHDRTLSEYDAEHGPASPKKDMSMRDMLLYAIEIALGMNHLISRGCIHRDLAARNVLVCQNFVMKIADFGLARDIYGANYYKKTSGGPLPVRWMAPEALIDRIYTAESDVWSYGVLLYEIYSYGSHPYPTVPIDDLIPYLKSGQRMTRPEACSPIVYALMNKCWSMIPSERPTFSEIITVLSAELDTMPSEADPDVTTTRVRDNPNLFCLADCDVFKGSNTVSSKSPVSKLSGAVPLKSLSQSVPNVLQCEAGYLEAQEPLLPGKVPLITDSYLSVLSETSKTVCSSLDSKLFN